MKPNNLSYEELNGKTLKIVANENEDGLIVVGLCVETNNVYVLIHEPQVEGGEQVESD